MCSRPKLTVLETILLRNAGAAKRAYALSPCSDVPPNGFGFASHCRVSPTKGYSTPSVCSRPKPFGEKAIRRGSAPKPNDFAPIQFAAVSPKKFSTRCNLQDVLPKVLDPLQNAAAMLQAAPCRRMVWTCIALHRLLAKWLGSAASGGEYFSFGLML